MISKKKKILSALLASSVLIPQTALVAFADSSEDVGISLAEQTGLVQAEEGTDAGSFTVSYSVNGVNVKDVDKTVLYIGDELKFTIRPAEGYEIVRAYNESKAGTEFTDVGDGSFEQVFEIFSIPGANRGYVGVAGGPWGSYIYVQTRAVEGGSGNENSDSGDTRPYTRYSDIRPVVFPGSGTSEDNYTVSYSINGVKVDSDEGPFLYEGDKFTVTISPAAGYVIDHVVRDADRRAIYKPNEDGNVVVGDVAKNYGEQAGNYIGVQPETLFINSLLVTTRAVEGGGSDSADPSVDGTAESWSAIAANIGRLGKGKIETVNLNGFTIVPAEVFKAIANSGAKITFVSDEYESADGMFCWKFDGSDFKAADAKDADLTVRKRTINDTGSLRGTNGGGFTLNGTNNKASKLSVALGSENSGKFANLYKLELGRFKFVDTAIIDNNGKVSGFSVSEKGDYVVMLGSYSDMPGDADNNGVLNSLDAVVILKGVVGLAQAANPQAADVNGDGKTDAKDAVQILKIVVGLA